MYMDPTVKHHFSSGVYAKETRLPAGLTIISHRHKYDHLSILASGRVRVDVEGPAYSMKSEFAAPACIQIPAGHHHMIAALEDSTWYCIHATDVADEKAIDETLIAEPNMNSVVQLWEGK